MKIEVTQLNVLPEKITVARFAFKRTHPIGYWTYDKPKLCDGYIHTDQCDCEFEFDRERDINNNEEQV